MAGIGPAAMEKATKSGVVQRKADFETAVAAAVSKRTTSGDLVPKATVDQLCSTAKVAGINEGLTQVEQEQAAKLQAEKTAGERKTALTTAGLPLPDADGESIWKHSHRDRCPNRVGIFRIASRFVEGGFASGNVRGRAAHGPSVSNVKVEGFAFDRAAPENFSILLFYTICHFRSQKPLIRANAKSEQNHCEH